MNHQLVKEMAQILYDKKAQDIVALDVTGLTVITDCMLIASGRNTLQVRTLAEDLQERMAEKGLDPIRREGQQDGHWVVLDYGDVLVHIFHTEDREFYRLDKLWENENNRVALPFEEE
ncbi:MAG: ribosome silencing factor [Candidatus Limiplasma sp.]|nr:ribosome silencing factor [Clostridiales bacterium]MDY3816378.1 ribosome silencing factor [Candidatus Limiplasma sp.]